MENVSKRMHEKVKLESKPKRSLHNKTSTLRAQAVKKKIDADSDVRSGGPSKLGYGSFDSRSRSVLPPIASTRNGDSRGDFFGEDSRAFSGRKGSLDFASPQMKL